MTTSENRKPRTCYATLSPKPTCRRKLKCMWAPSTAGVLRTRRYITTTRRRRPGPVCWHCSAVRWHKIAPDHSAHRCPPRQSASPPGGSDSSFDGEPVLDSPVDGERVLEDS